MNQSVSYSTRPWAFLGARARLTMPRFSASAGSSSPVAVPQRRSYAPAAPNAAPPANGSVPSMRTSTMRACAPAAQSATPARSSARIGWRFLSAATGSLLEVNVVFLQDARPAPDLGVEKQLEVLGRFRERYRERRVHERIVYGLLVHRRDRRGEQLVHDRPRRLRLREHRVP